MKKTMSILILSILLFSAAGAETIRQQVGAPEHLTLEPFQTATGLCTFVIDATVEVPDVENVKTYAYASQGISEESALALVRVLGITGVKKVSFDEEFTMLQDDYASFSYTKNSHFLVIRNINYGGKYTQGSIQYKKLNNKIGYDSMRGELVTKFEGDCAEDTSYPFADARALACEIAAAFAPELQLGLAGIATGFQNLTDQQRSQLNDPNYKGTKPKMHVYGGYSFLFHQVIDGIPIIITNSQGIDTEFNYTLFPERLCMVISEGKVVSMDMNATGKLGAVKRESCELLDFATVLGIAQKILPLQYATDGIYPSGTPQTTTSIDYTIDRITFGYMRVMVKDQPNSFELIPVWDFFGNRLYLGVYDNKTPLKYYYPTQDRSYLTINAMDGTVIDRWLGY